MSTGTSFKNGTIPKIEPPLKVPHQSPRVGINDPGFEKLTTAEKLNDSNYRKLVYETHPDEATCACESPCNGSHEARRPPSNFVICRSGCNNSCCWRMRHAGVAPYREDNANTDDKVVPFASTYCIGNKRDKENAVRMCATAAIHSNDHCCNSRRLRGGGEGIDCRGEKETYTRSESGNRTTQRWSMDARNCRDDCTGGRHFDSATNVSFRYAKMLPLYRNLAQASKVPYQYVQRSKENDSRKRPQELNRYGSNLYRSLQYDSGSKNSFNASIPAACSCPGKEILTQAIEERKTNMSRGKKGLPVIDCLVKAFQETQDFVDGLGKVPGLAGLGLMDPAESPYFGRSRKNDSELEENKAAVKSSGGVMLSNPQCTGPCNTEALRLTDIGLGDSSTVASPYSMFGASGRGRVVREAVPAMPEPGLTFPPAKWDKKDDNEKTKETDPVMVANDTEPTPCGEPRCASKRRKTVEPSEAPTPVETEETIEKKNVTLVDISVRKASESSHRIKTSQRFRSGRKISDTFGRNSVKSGRKRSSVRSGKRIISFVYSAGDTYPGEGYNHKNCVEERQRVPGNMGWLWNLNETVGRLKPRPGWRPGAIGRHLREMLRDARANYSRLHKTRSKSSGSSRSRSRSPSPNRRRGKTQGDRRSARRKRLKNKHDDKDDVELPPTLYIQRKSGTYYVTMYPIKQDTMDVPKLEEPMKPLQFKIAKNRDDASVATSSTASDMEIEFSPPAAVNRYRRKPNVVHVDTQVKQQEIIDAFKVDDVIPIKIKTKKKAHKKR